MWSTILSWIPGFSSTKIAIAAAIIIAIMGGAFYWYYDVTQAKIVSLSVEIATAMLTIDAKNEVIKGLREDLKKIKEANQRVAETKARQATNLQKTKRQINQDANKAIEIAKKNLAAANGALNRITQYRNRCIEIASGSKIKPEERNVSVENRNTICPNLFNYR